MSFDAEQIVPAGARIKVIGIGGGGGNAVNTMIRSNIEGVEFMTANTDVQALRSALAPNKIQIGKELTKGLGAGADPDIGRDAALEDRHEIQEMVSGADMVFVTAGMGGGTGTGGAGVIAQIAREAGALTVGVVTKPFNFEGKRRRRHAEAGIARLKENVDTLIMIPNQRLLQVATPDLTMIDAFKLADDVLVNAVRGISDIINVPGTVNVDFADVKTVMSCMGQALMGIGIAEGDGRAIAAATQAIASPLLEDVDIEGATGLLINITAGASISLMEVNEACSIIQEAAHEDANIIFGAVIDENMGNSIRVTVIATGFPGDAEDEDFHSVSEVSRPAGNTATAGALSARGESIEQNFNLTSGSSRSGGYRENTQRNPLDTTPRNRLTGGYPSRPGKTEPKRNNSVGDTLSTISGPRFDNGRTQRATELRSESAQATNHSTQAPIAANDFHQQDRGAESNSPAVHGANEIGTPAFSPDVAGSPLLDSADSGNRLKRANKKEKYIDSLLGIDKSDELLSVADDSGHDIGAGDVAGFSALATDGTNVEDIKLEGAHSEKDHDSKGGDLLELSETDSNIEFTGDINQTIDEALEMASRISSDGGNMDDLDVPAFLRKGVKDYPSV